MCLNFPPVTCECGGNYLWVDWNIGSFTNVSLEWPRRPQINKENDSLGGRTAGQRVRAGALQNYPESFAFGKSSRFLDYSDNP
mgnify:CR=1 FL=1